MKLIFEGYPYYVPLEVYENSMRSMIEKLKKEAAIASIYQIGSISNPGISDIDMVLVLREDRIFKKDPLEGLSKLERYLFLHPLHGVSRSDFVEAKQYALFHNWQLLWGEEQTEVDDGIPEKEFERLRIQTALEYLVSNYISLTVLIAYAMCNVRAMLLTLKEMLYDLKLLGISSGRLWDLLEKLVEWRGRWFGSPPSEKLLTELIYNCHSELHIFLETLFQKEKLYLPQWATLRIAKNVSLLPSGHFSVNQKGIVLPLLLRFLGKNYFKIQRHLNEFMFYLPIQTTETPSVLLKRFELEYKMVSFCKRKELMPLRSTLNYIRKVHFQSE